MFGGSFFRGGPNTNAGPPSTPEGDVETAKLMGCLILFCVIFSAICYMILPFWTPPYENASRNAFFAMIA